MEKPSGHIRIVAISGSVRSQNFTSKALNLVVDELRKDPDIIVETIDPREIHLNLPGKESDDDSTEVIQKIVSQATGIIFATPEYHGSYSSVIKLIIDNLGFPSVLAGKTVGLLGVAAGQIGAVKAIEHLRSVCSHVGAIVLPGQVSIANVHKIFDDQGRCLDPKVEQRVRSLAKNMLDYIEKHVCPRKAFEEIVRENT